MEFEQYLQKFERIGYRMPVGAILFYFFVGLFPPVVSQPVVWWRVSSRNKPVRMEAGIPEVQHRAVCRK